MIRIFPALACTPSAIIALTFFPPVTIENVEAIIPGGVCIPMQEYSICPKFPIDALFAANRCYIPCEHPGTCIWANVFGSRTRNNTCGLAILTRDLRMYFCAWSFISSQNVKRKRTKNNIHHSLGSWLNALIHTDDLHAFPHAFLSRIVILIGQRAPFSNFLACTYKYFCNREWCSRYLNC